jgi:hypothetical protein
MMGAPSGETNIMVGRRGAGGHVYSPLTPLLNTNKPDQSTNFVF